jgi:uncharacterized membrane protein
MIPRSLPALRVTHALALASLTGLIVLGVAWELWLAPTGRGTLAIKVLPLLFFVAGLWRDRLHSYRALSLLTWLYFAEGAVRAVTDRGLSARLAMLEIVLSLLLFGACVGQVRARAAAAA